MIHPTAIIGEPPEHRDHPNHPYRTPASVLGVWIGDDVRIEAYVTVDAGAFQQTEIGARTWLMKKVHVGHDAVIGEDCEIAPLTSIGGEVIMGNRVKVGQGATFKPQVEIGDDAVIGMGAVVTKDVPAGETWAGNPAKPLRKLNATGEVLTELEMQGWEELAARCDALGCTDRECPNPLHRSKFAPV